MRFVTTIDWPKVTIEDVALDVTVGHVGPMADEYLESGVPFLRSLSVERFSIREEGLKFISQDFHKKLKKSALAPGDVVIVRTGKPGTCAVVPEWLADANCSDLVIVRCGPQVRPHFLCYIVNSIAGEHIDAHTVGAVQQHFNVGSARTLSFLLPPIKEQDRILALLRALDDKIELSRKMNATLEAMARALFRDWFVDFGPTRAKMEGRAPYLAPDLWALFPDQLGDEGKPKGWGGATIGNKLSTKLGGTPSRKDLSLWGGNIPWINSGKTNDFRVIEPSECITHGGLEKSATKLLPRRTTLIAITGATLGKVSLNEIEVCANQSIVGVIGSTEYPGEFVYLWIKENIESLIATQTGGAQQHINKGNVDELSLLCPLPEVMNAWRELAKPIFDRIAFNCFESRTLAQTRDLLLPRLMSGELRVAEASQSLEAVM